MTSQTKPKLKNITKRWVKDELSALQLQEELTNNYGDDPIDWERLAHEVDALQQKKPRAWRPLLLNTGKIVLTALFVAALVYLGWQVTVLSDQVAQIAAAPTMVVETTETTPEAKEAPAETPVAPPTELPQPQVSAIVFEKQPERLYVNGDLVELNFTVRGQNLEGKTITFSLNPKESDTKITNVNPIHDGSGSLILTPGNKVGTVSIVLADFPKVKGLPSVDILPTPNITVTIVSSIGSIDETNSVTYTLALTNAVSYTVYAIQAECQLPPQLQFADNSIGAKIADNRIILTEESGESLNKGENREYSFQASLAENAEYSTGQVACNVTAEGLKTDISRQSPALTIVRRGIEIKNVTVDPPYMATEVESTITAEIWQGGVPLTKGVTVTVTAGAEPLLSGEAIIPTTTGTITFTVKPGNSNVGQPVTMTVSYEDESNALLDGIMVYPTLEVKTDNLSFRMGPDVNTIEVVKVVDGSLFSIVRKKGDQWVQVCCEGGHLIWNGSGANHRTIYPDLLSDLVVPVEFVDFTDDQKIYTDPNESQPLLNVNKLISNNKAMIEMVDEANQKVRLRGWIVQDNIDLENGTIKANDGGTLPELILSLFDEGIKIPFEIIPENFTVEIVSKQRVGQNDNLIPIIVEGYLGE